MFYQIADEEHAMLVSKMSRYIILKGSRSEPLVVTKLNDEIIPEKYRKLRIGRLVFSEAACSVKSVFGYEVRKAPEKHFTQSKFKDVYYLVNGHSFPSFREDLLWDSKPALRGLLMVRFK